MPRFSPALHACCSGSSRIALAILGTLSFGAAAHAQYVMMPDSTNNRVVLFDPVNGSLVNPNYFGITASTTPVHAMQVDGEIWISEQIGDKISRWSLAGTPLGSITGALDNLRGMELVGNTVFLCNDGTANGAPGPSLQMFNTSGVFQGFFSTAAFTTGPFGVLDHQGDLLASSDAPNNDVHRYKPDGTDVGLFHNSTSLNFAEQMDHDPTGNVLVAGFSSNNVVTLNANTGALVSSFAASGARGVYQLGNGNVLWTNGSGVHVWDMNTGASTQVYAGAGRFLDDLVIPEPGTLALGLSGGAMLAMRRRRPA